MKKSTSVFHLGLTGYPLRYSFSPKMHTAALKACGLEGDYSLFPVHPDDSKGLKDLLGRVRSCEIQGLNVTIPHKQNVIQWLDELTPIAKTVGAVNTIYLKDKKLIGDNTDVPGFQSDLRQFLFNRKSEIENRKLAVVLGAGGAARAVVYALLDNGWEVTITSRRIEQARQLSNTFTGHKLCIADSFLDIELSNVDLIVNTTPVGMSPNVDQSPLPGNLSLPPHISVYDLVYNPRETKLISNAHAQEVHAITGLGMLIEQAALAFEIWTGHNPPRNVFYESVEHPVMVNQNAGLSWRPAQT